MPTHSGTVLVVAVAALSLAPRAGADGSVAICGAAAPRMPEGLRFERLRGGRGGDKSATVGTADEDSLHEELQVHLSQLDELADHMSQFQERSAALADELEKRAAENVRLVRALETVLPCDDLDHEAIRRRDVLESMGLPSAMALDTPAPATTSSYGALAGAAAAPAEIGSSPPCFMDTVDTPAHLRGGGGSWASRRHAVWSFGRQSEGSNDVGVVKRLALRGGGNVLTVGSKYSAKEHALNKQLCGAVKRGDDKEIRRLVKEGADPSYPDCDMLGFSALHHAVNTRQTKSLEALQQLGGNVHIKDGLGWTLMHQAAHNADVEMVDKLHRFGVSSLVKNNAGRLPSAVTKAAGNGPQYRDCYKKLLGIQETAAGSNNVQKVVDEKMSKMSEPEESDDDDDLPASDAGGSERKKKA